jgi:hypothetical protein
VRPCRHASPAAGCHRQRRRRPPPPPGSAAARNEARLDGPGLVPSRNGTGTGGPSRWRRAPDLRQAFGLSGFRLYVLPTRRLGLNVPVPASARLGLGRPRCRAYSRLPTRAAVVARHTDHRRTDTSRAASAVA